MEFGNQNISTYIADRIKDVKIPREGKCVITTHDQPEGNKIKKGRRYTQEEVSKLLSALRQKNRSFPEKVHSKAGFRDPDSRVSEYRT